MSSAEQLRTLKGYKKSNAWVEYVKKYALENNIAYGCALSHKGLSDDYKNKKPIAKYNVSNDLDKLHEEYRKKGYDLKVSVAKLKKGIIV